jgi:hypothetical protein
MRAVFTSPEEPDALARGCGDQLSGSRPPGTATFDDLGGRTGSPGACSSRRWPSSSKVKSSAVEGTQQNLDRLAEHRRTMA